MRDIVPYFPRGAIHLVVVDPGVGTERRPMILRTGWLMAVGPDNGVLSLLWEGDRQASFFQIDEAAVARGPVSSTFHGRDLFAPAAALLATGVKPEELGDPLPDPVELELPLPVREQDVLLGEVLYHDRFGNLVTNIRRDHLPGDPQDLLVEIGGRTTRGLVRTYAHGGAGLIALIGSTGLLEIAVRKGSAYETLRADFGTKVRVSVLERRRTTGR
ncbi:MAG: SAM-dependent chlorinase/fluorinase [Deltaproteobacteria bacterium]|nr:SAM-dependent chlorinase/fluorinase [Deltaproteobacteria bacterium]